MLINDALNTFYLKNNYLNKKRKEGNVLINDALNTFYLRLCRIRIGPMCV